MKKSLYLIVTGLFFVNQSLLAKTEILNVSYDISRELYAEINASFIPYYEAKTKETVSIKQSHAGSSKQARSILQGLNADVVTFNQVLDVNVLYEQGEFIAQDWQAKYPNQSSPYYSLPAFLVRKDNPKNIQDWSDLTKPDVEIILPNPKTSGNGRYSFLASQVWAKSTFKNDDKQVAAFSKAWLNNIKLFTTGGRSASILFTERKTGDVLLTFEAEILNILDKYPNEYELVLPSQSLIAEFPVAVIEKNTEKNDTQEVSKAYLNYLYTTDAQRIIAKHYNRVIDATAATEVKDVFKPIELKRIEDIFGSWAQINETYFAKNGLYDQAIGK